MIDAAGLRVIQAIAQQGSFTAAAVSLGYSQPAVSQMVRRLEERAGTPLVERMGRSVRLTEAGLVLARHAGPVLSSLQAAESEVAAIAGLRAGRVRLVAFPSATSTVVPLALAKVKAEFPDVKVTFVEAEPPEAIAALRSGSCDLAVIFSYDTARADEDIEGLEITDLLDDDVLVALPKDHPLAGADAIDLSLLATESWIAGCPRCRGHLIARADEAGFEPDVAFETEDYVASLALVSVGLGVSLVPRLIADSTPHADVVTKPLTVPARRTVSAVSTRDLKRVPAVAAALAALESVSATSPAVTG